MKRFVAIVFMVWVILILSGVAAYAGPMDDIKTWLIDKAVYALIPIVLGFGAIAIWTDWFCLLLVSIGGALTTIGLAFRDRRLTKEELAGIRIKLAAVQDAVKKRPKKE